MQQSLCRTQTARNYSLATVAGITAFAGDNARALRLEALIDGSAWPESLRSRACLPYAREARGSLVR